MAGVTVSATRSEASKDTTKAIPSGRKKRPSIPSRDISGAKTSAIMTPSRSTMAGLISLLASKTTSRFVLLRSIRRSTRRRSACSLPEHVLDIDDRVVDQAADRDGETRRGS